LQETTFVGDTEETPYPNWFSQSSFVRAFFRYLKKIKHINSRCPMAQRPSRLLYPSTGYTPSFAGTTGATDSFGSRLNQTNNRI
jgi:hypothetical protein